MYSYSFDRAGHSMKDIRATAKHTFPELYMVGNFFVTFMKVFSTLTNLIICYFLMSHEGSRYTQVIHMVVPLIVTIFPYRSSASFPTKWRSTCSTPLD